jgi:hypothetical protein
VKAVRIILAVALSLGAAMATTAGAQTASATKPAADKPIEQTFMDDTLKFPVPDGWRVLDQSDDTTSVLMKNAEHDGVLVIKTSPQTASLTQNDLVRQKLSEAIVQQANAMLERRKDVEIIDKLKLKRDEGFFIRMEGKFREGGKLVEQVYVYRAMGIHLMYVQASAWGTSPEKTADIWKTAELLVHKITANKVARRPGVPTGNKPSIFRKAKVQWTAPKGWVEEKKDADEGVIATYRQPMVGSGVVTVRIVPVIGKPAPDLADRIAKESLTSAAFEGMTPKEIETVGGSGFESKLRQKYEGVEPTKRVETRVKIVGEVVVSVTSSGNDFKSDIIGAWADELTKSIQPFVK